MALRFVAYLLFVLALPSFAGALPVVAGFGDSITCDSCMDGSYLRLLGDYLDPDPIIDDNGMWANRTGTVLSRLDTWLDSNTADVLVLLTGTPDTYQAVGGWKDRPYNPLETLGNIEDMIDIVLGESIPVILVAPLPVLDPCNNPVALTCDDIDGRLADLADDLALVAVDKGVLFLDLYAAFMNSPQWASDPSLHYQDGVHPVLGREPGDPLVEFPIGDDLIASLLAPMIEQALIPEPSTAVLLASGLLALAYRQRRRAA